MQKQEEIVSKLDKEEKLALAASLTATAEPWAEQSDIPRVNFYDFATENGGVYPDLSVLAQTLNTELVSDVMQDLAAKTEKKGLFCLNNMGVKDNPYRAGISEDPYVCGAAAEAAARGIRKAGMIPCFTGYVPASDSEEITLSQMREVFLSPLYSKPQRECTVYRENFPKNTDQSYSAWSKLLHSAAEKNGYIIDEKGSDLSAGNILLGGDKEILRAAAEKNGSQILDKAAEQAVGLALECAGGKVKNGESFDREKYALRAAEESVVLLKNKVVLPLMRSKKLAFIGLHKEDRRQAFEKAVNKDKYFQLAGFSEGYGNDFDITKLRYDKIIIMADADVDGAHISTLLLTLFYRFMPDLIYEGHVYIAMPPLYKAMPSKGKEEYLYDDKALERYRKTHKGPFTLQRYKGLGEMDAQQLWETTLNPVTRRLRLVEIEDARMASEVTEVLMGTEVPPRKAFIYDHARDAELDV